MAGKGGDDAWKQKYDDLEDSLQTFRHQATKIKESLAKEVFHFSKFSCPNVWVMGAPQSRRSKVKVLIWQIYEI